MDWLAGVAGDYLEFNEDYMDVLSNPWFVLARENAKSYAKAYHLPDEDVEAFEELWGLTINATLSAHANHEDAIDAVIGELGVLGELVELAPTGPTPFGRPISVLDDDGFATMQVASTNGKYAIFSDHHMLYDGHRQNFFHDGSAGDTMDNRRPVTSPAGGIEPSGNRDLYVQVLNEYYAVLEYTLIENGDVEELIILEPVLSEITGIQAWSWPMVLRYREDNKLPQLRKIVQDNHAYYSAVQSGFIAHQRYIRLTGNHDRDMRLQEFADTVSATAGIDMPLASDVLLLRDGPRVDYIICHGHQFDTACTPAFADIGGESFSQASAWAFQGPDRVWRTDKDPIAEWLSGERSFANALVTDEPSVKDNWDIPWPINKTGKEIVALLTTSLPEWFATAIGSLETPAQWENIYDKNIAWEYFKHQTRTDKAIDEEVKTGDRWFKFRHLNEMRIADEMRRTFPGHDPHARPGPLSRTAVSLRPSQGDARAGGHRLLPQQRIGGPFRELALGSRAHRRRAVTDQLASQRRGGRCGDPHGLA